MDSETRGPVQEVVNGLARVVTEEPIAKTLFSTGLLVISYLLRSINELVFVLLIFFVFDWVAGTIASIVEGNRICMKKILIGLAKKFLMFMVVLAAALADFVAGRVGLETREAFHVVVTVWLIAHEAISFLRNVERTGAPVPPKFKELMSYLREETEKGGG